MPTTAIMMIIIIIVIMTTKSTIMMGKTPRPSAPYHPYHQLSSNNNVQLQLFATQLTAADSQLLVNLTKCGSEAQSFDSQNPHSARASLHSFFFAALAELSKPAAQSLDADSARSHRYEAASARLTQIAQTAS
jgi:hypothetical protein